MLSGSRWASSGVVRELRRTSRVPVIMLTARGDEMDRIVGLELGADDYLGKPFNPRELLARIQAVLRRADGSGTESELLRAGPIEVDPGARTVTLNGEPIQLTTTQFEIPNPLTNQGDFTLVDFSAIWTSVDGKYELGMYARNLFDEEYIAAAYDFPTIANSVIGFYGPPRTFTLSGTVNFF